MIWGFGTKTTANQFIQAFIEKQDNRFFPSIKKDTGEKYYNFHWPDWGYKLDKDVEIAFQGLIRNTHELVEIVKRNHNKYYYFDQPYFFATGYQIHKETNSMWYRICVNNTQKTFISKDKKYKKRYEDLYSKTKDELTLKPWRENGEHILVIPPSYHTAKWYGIDRHKWTEQVIKEIKKTSRRPIRVRYKYVENADWGTKVSKPLKEDLENCWAMVSWHSMCAIEAVVNGVPSFTSQHSPAKPVSLSLDNLDIVDDPHMPDREQWLYSLTGAQFTLDEMKSGYAYNFLQEEK